MDVDTATQAPAKHHLPEIEIFCYLIVLIFLIDHKKYGDVSFFANESVFFFRFLLILSDHPDHLPKISG